MISGHQEGICLKLDVKKTSSTKGVEATRDANKLKPILLETACFSFLDFVIALLVYLIYFACLYKVIFPKYFAFLAKKILK